MSGTVADDLFNDGNEEQDSLNGEEDIEQNKSQQAAGADPEP